ncbi:prolipoprotein diacylglyceryl transferase [Tautonia plasticadhaerens]|uniref:Phosphatidylglycerol--prolipoprotein diacylglyceryl transferase n=1 Tax=Tautonia plasticadhaerens TaxID=2527974 RepID=A0A518H2Z5_9BACT|nr:prolipoprotein diacylglyceryl transferase [Tautonia plasticadhaerens]QDV35200.1 Prolipoprotein diacylglyceryl transferase [Tautonia plasticadhaerens]
MLQVLYEIPGTGIRIHGFGLMLFLAFLAAMNLSAYLARRSRVDPNDVFDLALWLIVGGLVGARLFYVVQHRESVDSPLDAFKVWEGGIVLYGSGLGAAAAFLLFWRRRRFPFAPMLDVAAPAVALGVALGRIGCFLNGCCYGDTCDLPWAVSFPQGTLPWMDQVRSGLIDQAALRSLPVHPTQLYSALDGLILAGLLLAYYPLRRRDGEVMALLAVTYPITRFLIEQLRDDEGAVFLGMTISQNGSLLLMLLGLAAWAWLSTRPKGRYADALVAAPASSSRA